MSGGEAIFWIVFFSVMGALMLVAEWLKSRT